MFNYKWNLKDGYKLSNQYKVFGTFVCGGGSTMGYKLAGFNHLGGVELDKKISEIYKINHNPKYFFNEDIRTFNDRIDLPAELFDLDILDGSPPCSSFSLSGRRDKDWGQDKKFLEGQKKQILDELIFEYIKTIEKLKPKIAILENVRGLIVGNSKAYLINAIEKLKEINYEVQVFLLNAATMKIPQDRKRIFVICKRKDLNFPKLNLNFDNEIIPFKKIDQGKAEGDKFQIPSDLMFGFYQKCKHGKSFSTVHPKKHLFNNIKIDPTLPTPTLTSSSQNKLYHPTLRRKISLKEIMLAQSFPLDYNFQNCRQDFIVGMSVPPLMIANIAYQIKLQLLDKLEGKKEGG